MVDNSKRNRSPVMLELVVSEEGVITVLQTEERVNAKPLGNPRRITAAYNNGDIDGYASVFQSREHALLDKAPRMANSYATWEEEGEPTVIQDRDTIPEAVQYYQIPRKELLKILRI